MNPRPPVRGRTLLLFTQSFPFDVALEDTFLRPELPHLLACFERVIVIPRERQGSQSALPHGVELDQGLAGFLAAKRGRLQKAARVLTSKLVRDDVLRQPLGVTHRRGLVRLISGANQSELTRRWFLAFLARRDISAADCVAYTFWCDPVTTGLCLSKANQPGLVVVSRAHGADLYADRYDPPYLPARRFTLRHLDRLFPDSDRGVRYVADRFPWFATKCEVARLGVDDPGFVAHASPPGQFVIVSCSRFVEIKRVDKILEGVAALARSRPLMQIEWHHFGEGALKAAIERQAAATLPPNARARFPGYSSVGDLLAFYRDYPVDAFVNASRSEGTPVSIMEAISCGIPVIATEVGGNPEIVSERNGVLVSPAAGADEFSTAFAALIDEPDHARRLRLGSREAWAKDYDAQANYSAFARLLRGLRPST